MLKIELSISELVAIELMLMTTSDAFKASAREAERLDLLAIAEYHRTTAAKAAAMSDKLRAALTKAAEAA